MVCNDFQECMPSASTISLLCLEDTPSRSQRCFAVYHNNVIIYNLLSGSCVGHLKELHPREITAVLFFNPLKVPHTYILCMHCDGICTNQLFVYLKEARRRIASPPEQDANLTSQNISIDKDFHAKK